MQLINISKVRTATTAKFSRIKAEKKLKKAATLASKLTKFVNENNALLSASGSPMRLVLTKLYDHYEVKACFIKGLGEGSDEISTYFFRPLEETNGSLSRLIDLLLLDLGLRPLAKGSVKQIEYRGFVADLTAEKEMIKVLGTHSSLPFWVNSFPEAVVSFRDLVDLSQNA